MDAEEKKAAGGAEGWRAGLEVWGRVVLVERLVALEDFDGARKEVEAVAARVAKCREGFMTMWKARIAQAEYLDLVNSNPDLPYTDNFSITQHGNVFHITYQGEHRFLSIGRTICRCTTGCRWHRHEPKRLHPQQ